jgi:hypothetical protein
MDTPCPSGTRLTPLRFKISVGIYLRERKNNVLVMLVYNKVWKSSPDCQRPPAAPLTMLPESPQGLHAASNRFRIAMVILTGNWRDLGLRTP